MKKSEIQGPILGISVKFPGFLLVIGFPNTWISYGNYPNSQNVG